MIDFYKGNTLYYNKELYTVLTNTNITKQKTIQGDFLYVRLLLEDGDLFLITIELPMMIDENDINTYDFLIKELLKYKAITKYISYDDRVVTCTDLIVVVEDL